MSASSGTKVAELPNMPSTKQWMSVNHQIEGAAAASMKPSPTLTEPISTGTRAPYRSSSRPISMPPMPNPIIIAV